MAKSSFRLAGLAGWLSTAVLGVGCTGSIGQPTGRAAAAGASEAEEGDPIDPFVIPREQIQLLPFDVRLRRVATVVGLDIADPALDALRASHVELGDGDFAHGIAADRTWTAAKMSLWVRSVSPVCASGAMHARYPTLVEDASTLVQAAYGRRAEHEDQAEIDAALAGQPFDQETRFKTICLAVLSSAEMVAQ